jgi:hypothetical protein
LLREKQENSRILLNFKLINLRARISLSPGDICATSVARRKKSGARRLMTHRRVFKGFWTRAVCITIYSQSKSRTK